MSLHWQTILELGRDYRSGRASPVEVTKAMLDRIGHLDGRLHAFVHPTPETARAAAEVAERELRAGTDRGPLHGIPLGVKDLCTTKDAPTGAGTTFLARDLPREDATVVARLREAGAVILGKLTLTEGAFAEHHPAIPTPLNLWKEDRWSGASSSGSGVSVAAGLAFGALGTDTGGSIRFPSAVDGIVGLKPTRGRVPLTGVFPLATNVDHVGPMARSVGDAAVMLRAIAGRDPGDPALLFDPVPDYLASASAGARGLRVGVDEAWMSEGMDPAIITIVREGIEALRTAGADIVPVALPAWESLVGHWGAACAVGAARAHAPWIESHRSDYGPFLGLLHGAQGVDAILLDQIDEERHAFGIGLAGLFREIDLLACPSMRLPVPPLPIDVADDATLGFAPFDFSGSPTISLRCGFDADGLPVSLQLVGRHLDEETLVRAGAAFERATSWHDRHPGP